MSRGIRRNGPALGCGVAKLAAVALLGCCSQALALPPLPLMACPVISAKDAPRIDGTLDEAAWAEGDVQTTFHRYYGQLDRPQDFRLLTDGQWLYVGVRAYEREIAARDNESVVIQIAPYKDSDQHEGFSIIMNAQGIIETQPPTEGGIGDNLKAAFRQHEDRWVAEIAIRVEPVFGRELTKGKVFDFNLDRTRYRVVGDSFDILQQWSNTGTSSGSRYRFGEVTVGRPADRVPVIRGELSRALELARGRRGDLSAVSLQEFTPVEQEAEALLAASPGAGVLTSGAVREYQSQADALRRKLQRAILVQRGTIVWACDPMTVPKPSDLPSVDQEDVKRLDIRVLGDEWESAALVVTNLKSQTLDGQVLLTDFVSADGKTKLPGWDVLQVRTAPQYLLHSGRKKRDPLPRLQEGDLFRVSPDENELLWLTFRSRNVPPGRYRATLTVRALDDQLQHDVVVVFRVYPLALGAEGRPRVNVWNSMLRGADWAERAANCRDYYITCVPLLMWDEVPVFTADPDGNLLSDTLDFAKYDRGLSNYMKSGVHTYLATIEHHKYRFWPMRLEGQKWNEVKGSTFPFKRWSPRFNKVFAKWVVGFRAHMDKKGLPPERWAFYIMDEPAFGEERQEVIEFARQVRLADPQVRTYITLPIKGGDDDAQNIEVSQHVDIIQGIGQARPEIMAQLMTNVTELWSYGIKLRGSNPFDSYRRGACWEPMRRGDLGTGFWVWDGQSSGSFLWRDNNKGNKFAALYNHHDNTIITSLRAEAFREGIEDWKYVLMLDDALARAKSAGVDAQVLGEAAAFRADCLSELEGVDSITQFRDGARSHLLRLHAALGEVDMAVVEAIERD